MMTQLGLDGVEKGGFVWRVGDGDVCGATLLAPGRENPATIVSPAELGAWFLTVTTSGRNAKGIGLPLVYSS